MKHIALGIISSLLIFSQSYGFISYTESSCFREIANIARADLTETILLSSKYSDLIVKQGGNLLEVSDYNKVYKYIPFQANIEQSPLGGYYHNIYSFENLDTDLEREIILNFDETIPKDTFYMNFGYDSQYYTPSFFISENGSQYSQVLERDISDYSIKNIKIVFKARGKESIREIIKIHNLSIARNNHSLVVSGIDTSRDLILYGGNSCGPSRDTVTVGESVLQNIAMRSLVFVSNSLYKEDTSDSDSDGVSDLRDNCKTVKNRDQKDVNQNGVGDACEFDSDNDSIPDEVDNCRNTANTDQADNDNDRIGNLCDNCDYYNPSQADTDENGVGDICDAQKKYIEENDDDNDGVENSKDNCKLIANSNQEDTDSDGVGDVCDNCKTFQNHDQADSNENGVGDICEDSDNDGIDSLQDNCVNVANPGQEDSDNDGVGNLCEDDDGDTIIFSSDNCPYVYNPLQEDFDTDGVGDACDESDDRFLESNKGVFIALMILIILLFIGGIYAMSRKIQK